MLQWFEKTAPIRTKFKALTALLALIGTTGPVTTWLAGGSTELIGAASASLAATVIAMIVAARHITTPYVNTVMRMEALADGDTDSPIQYTDYKDCVGRMTKAMATFRNNAVALRSDNAAQEKTIIDALSGGLKKLSSNQLDCEIRDPFPGAYDDLRRDFNAAVRSLADTIRSVRTAAASVRTGATEIRSASDDFAARNERQAASLAETASSMNDVTTNVKRTADKATDVQQAVSGAHREATEGGEVVRKAIVAMGEIEKSAQEIGQIINVIDGIAFQTNLLALNAGVEAARAGDAGKGFAVVANEVRALAQRSAEAAKNIKELITVSSKQVGDGVVLVGDTGSLLEKIVASVGDIDELMSEIASNATQQASNLQQINDAVSEMDRLTQQNAAMVEQSTAASRSLADEANEMTSLVSSFVTGEEDIVRPMRKYAPPAPSAPAPSFHPAPRSQPVAMGNVALQSVPTNDEDWSEF
ncbi:MULTISPECIES: methyl-accepting chemotaxis protein [Novosphingobium]|uniref:Methyl-accepting chemotaxis protein n=1 Tax=Novosphingobium mathurense TaxID=428990 RepID=A0A1U6GTS1_9SPHN|nr:MULTISPECIES: methyl-accepting chemotaxis protein [Novosphingobium]CDO37577.1 Chemotaxis methyl-accepting protein [Novosphingobium sp. KN65.2]SLJ86929.1 methyl-accepting chemotaxis protein [Novosphingobium mathurense]